MPRLVTRFHKMADGQRPIGGPGLERRASARAGNMNEHHGEEEEAKTELERGKREGAKRAKRASDST